MGRLHISVAKMGTPDLPRYVIRDNKGRYWTGTWWTDTSRRARLYHDKGEAEGEAGVMTDCIEPRWFIASVIIMVEHDGPFTIEQLRELLKESAVSLVMPDEHDLDGVDIELNIDVGGMEETE